MTSQIAYNLNHINSRIQWACAHSGRNPLTVKVLLATKTVRTGRKPSARVKSNYRQIMDCKSIIRMTGSTPQEFSVFRFTRFGNLN